MFTLLKLHRLERHVKEHNTVKRKGNSAQKRGRARLANRCDTCKIGFKTELEFNKHMNDNVHTSK